MKPYLLLYTFCIAVFFIRCSSTKSVSTQVNSYSERKLLLRDEGISQLSYIDIANPKANWFVPGPAGRDIQLVGNGRVLIGTGNGYEEHEISTGSKVYKLTSFPGTLQYAGSEMAIHLIGENWHGKKGIVLVELNSSNNIPGLMFLAGFNYPRLVRETLYINY